MKDNNKASESAYQALMGTIFGTGYKQPVDENPIIKKHRTEWLHENLTDNEIWEIVDTLKWQQEMK
jgi:hypothetical protein